MNNPAMRWTVVIVTLLVIMSIFGISPFGSSEKAQALAQQGQYLNYSSFYDKVMDGEVVKISYKSGTEIIIGEDKSGVPMHTIAPAGSDLLEDARAKGVEIDVKPRDRPSALGGVLMLMLPVLLLIGAMIYLQRRQAREISTMTRGPVNASKSQEFVDPSENPHRLKDVAGCDEAKQEVSEIIDFLKNPEVYQRVGARAPKGVLMSGPPGTGKTLLAKAIAGEAGVPFISATGSDFMEMFVGVGAARVRSLFEKAKKNAPAIVFIDEIDSVGRQRSGANAWGGGNDERDQTLNALLTEMDGFSPSTNVVVIAATNRSDVLDEALRRPGRFDREVSMSLPDKAGRVDILRVHGKSIPVDLDVVWEEVAAGTPGFSGADLANLVNEAAVLAARQKASLVTMKHFDDARDKIIMGVQRSPLKNAREREIVAYHEAGHAIVAHLTPGSEPVHKISIVPRGRALGVTMQLPKEDSYNHNREKLLSDITVLMGGRAAEDVALSESTVGASNDFMRATVMARRMVASWGMDPEFGPVSIDGERGNDWAGSGIWSEDMKQDADRRVQKILKEHYARACEILRTNREALERVAQGLLAEETLDAKQFLALVNNEPLPVKEPVVIAQADVNVSKVSPPAASSSPRDHGSGLGGAVPQT